MGHPSQATFSIRQCLLGLLFVVAALSSALADDRVVRPFECEATFVPANPIDEHVLTALSAQGIRPANLCSDEVFVRRIHLDVAGTLPRPVEVRRFLQSRDPGKRAALIDTLLLSPEFAEYWALKWGDILRVKAEYPINLWPNAVQAYHRWIRQAIRENLPYDRFARELLTSSGSNFRVPAVNFYRAVQGRDAAALAAAVALTFMGARLEHWPEGRRSGMSACFSRVAFKGTAEWKEEIVYLSPARGGPREATLPDGKVLRLEEDLDPRQVFADWLIAADNPWFARSIVNRVWFWLMGRGIIHEPDDIRSDNPPVNPALLAYLGDELVRSEYDLRRVYRLILNSWTYQQSPIPRSQDARAEALFACYPVRRLAAEVLADALCSLFGVGDGYSSAIPEPFTFIPASQRTIALADGSITSQFLELFGRPARDTGLESERSNRVTAAQRLHLLNSTHVQGKVESRWWLRRLLRESRSDRRALARSVYLYILSRYPTPDELAIAQESLGRDGGRLRQGTVDLSWALVNSKEFLYRH